MNAQLEFSSPVSTVTANGERHIVTVSDLYAHSVEVHVTFALRTGTLSFTCDNDCAMTLRGVRNGAQLIALVAQQFADNEWSPL